MVGTVPVNNPFNDIPGFQCFACGPKHPHGLHLNLQKIDDQVFCRFHAKEEFSGFSNILHGGIQSTILDEVMWWAAFESRNLLCLTQTMEIEFRSPVHTGSDIVAMARVRNEQSNAVDVVGELRIGEEIVAMANGRYFFPSARLLGRALGVKPDAIPAKLLAYVNKT
jgi:acyl-coenzyme A thioesterase PaaI-like protein